MPRKSSQPEERPSLRTTSQAMTMPSTPASGMAINASRVVSIIALVPMPKKTWRKLFRVQVLSTPRFFTKPPTSTVP